MTEPILAGLGGQNGREIPSIGELYRLFSEWRPAVPGLPMVSDERRKSGELAYPNVTPESLQRQDLVKLARRFAEHGLALPDIDEWGTWSEPRLVLRLTDDDVDEIYRELTGGFAKWELEVFEGLLAAGYFGQHELCTAEEREALLAAAREQTARKYERAEYEDELRRQKLRERARRDAIRELNAEEVAAGLSDAEHDNRVIRGGAILDEPEGVPAVWGEGDKVLWAQGQGIMLVSQQGVGKTTIAQQVTLYRIGVRTGKFLDMPVADDGRTAVYLAMDRPQQAIGSFRRMLSEGHRKILDERLVIRKGPLPVDALAKAQALADYVQLIAPDAGTVIVDSVKDMVGGRSLSSDEVGAGINSAVQELLARGVEVLLLHHQRKAQNGSVRLNSLDDVFGSTLITSGLGSVFALGGTPGTLTPDLLHLKQPVMPVEMTLRHDHATGTTRVEDGPVECIDMLREAGEAGMTLVALARRRFGRADKSDTQRISRELKPHITENRVRKVPGQVTSEGRTGDVYVINSGIDRMRRSASGE